MGRSAHCQIHFVGTSRPHDGRVRSALFILLILVLGLGAGTAQGAVFSGNPVQVVASGPDALRFSVEDLVPVWTPAEIGAVGGTYFDVSLPGFVSSGEPGQVRVPRAGGWVLVPPGTRPVMRVVSEQWGPVGDRPLMVESVPVIIEGAEPWENFASEILVLPGQEPPADANIPSEALESLGRRGMPSASSAVTLGEVSWWRGRRIVSYQITPVRHDGSGMASAVLESGTWEILFQQDPQAGRDISAAQAAKSSTRNDNRFGSIFLNSELLARTPTEAAWQGLDFASFAGQDKIGPEAARGGKAGTPLGPESRLAVWKTGLVRVSYDQLRARRLIPDVPIAEDEVRLYQRRYMASLDDGSTNPPYVEIEVPIYMVGEGDQFDGDDFFVFYGLRLRDDTPYEADLGNGPEAIPGSGDHWEMNNEANLYWLAPSQPDPGQPWSRMAEITLPAASGPLVTNYRRTDHIEEQLAFRENVPNILSDRVYYNTYRSFIASVGINPLWSPDPTGSAVQLDVALAGWNQVSRPLRLELITDSNLTTPLEDFNIASMLEDTFSYTVPASAIDGNSAQVRLTNPVIPDWVYTFMNWVKISYDALFEATGNRLEFNCGDVAGPRPINVSGFESADIGLFEVTDPRNPVFVRLGAANVTTADNIAWTLSIMPDQGGESRLFASVGDFSTTGVDEFPSFLSSTVEDPTNPTLLAGAAPDLIVVTHPEFRAALNRWIAHRIERSGGQLTVHVVETDDLFDWYSGGLKDPWAIKRFMTHALTQWNSWALTVVGDANENALEKGVLPSARPWSRDWVPTHYHVQRALNFQPELLASDKWYATLESGTNYPTDLFPRDVQSPWEMYTGRFPCNSVAELDRMIDKVILVDNVRPDQDWRRQGIFFADDQWSNGYGASALDTLVYKYNETVFADSERDSLAPLWRQGSPVALVDSLVLLETYLDPLMPAYAPPPPTPAPRDLSDTRLMTASGPTPLLISRLSQGGLVAHYQGHANAYVLTSEYWMEDRNDGVGRLDVAKIGNTDKPWVFMGLGCHIADWAQNTVLTNTRAQESCIAEKFLQKSRSGASATYASSGYEYITENRVFGEYIFRRWMLNPPTTRTVGGDVQFPSRWVLGELMWYAEADIYSVLPTRFVQEMVAQYVILGDPLMGLDAGPPQVAATLVGNPDQEISGEADVFATDATNVRTVNLVAKDEAGIDRIQVTDSQGNNLTAGNVTESLPPGAQNQQIVNYSVQVPVAPYDHDVTIEVWDTGGSLDTDRHYQLLLHLPQTAEFSIDGSTIDPATFVFPAESPLNFSAAVTSAAWLLGYDPSTDFALTSETLTLSNIEFLLAKNQQLTANFTATSATQNPDDQHKVTLTIDGYPTDLVIQAGTGAEVSATIGAVYNFPNPMSDSTRFIFESGLAGGSGTVRVFSVAGRPVANIAFRFNGGGSGIVDWDGRDNAGDQMANGTYLYRVEIETSEGLVASDMQRLVMMR